MQFQVTEWHQALWQVSFPWAAVPWEALLCISCRVLYICKDDRAFSMIPKSPLVSSEGSANGMSWSRPRGWALMATALTLCPKATYFFPESILQTARIGKWEDYFSKPGVTQPVSIFGCLSVLLLRTLISFVQCLLSRLASTNSPSRQLCQKTFFSQTHKFNHFISF